MLIISLKLNCKHLLLKVKAPTRYYQISALNFYKSPDPTIRQEAEVFQSLQ